MSLELPRPEHPANIAPSLGLSVLDWHAYAIDEHAEHPIGVYVARCGHRLMMVTTVNESPPSRICPSCAAWTDQ